MNKNLNDKIIQVKDEIAALDLVKEYNFYRDLFLNSEELKQLNNRIKFLKKCEMSNEEKDEYYRLLNIYSSHPIVSNYNALKKDIEELKLEVKNLIKL